MTQTVRLFNDDSAMIIKEEYLRFLALNNVQVSYDSGDKTIIMLKDVRAAYAAEVIPNYYPLDVLRKLIRKDEMPVFLSLHGFNMLATKRVRSVNDLPDGDFVLKPIIGQYKQGVRAKNPSLEKSIVGIATTKTNVLKKTTVDELNKLLKEGYVAQEAVTGDFVEIITISGTTNNNSDAYFVRNARGKWKNGVILETSRTFNLPEAAKEQELLQTFLKTQNIKNASFNLQLILKNEKLYPMDWNFRLIPHFVMDCMKQDIREFHKALYHLLDIPNNLPETYEGSWFTERKGMDFKLHMDQPLIVRQSIKADA